MKFLKRYKNGFIEYGKYSVIGIVCAALDIGVLNALLYFFPTNDTVLLTIFNSTAYMAAILNSYYWNSKYTFKIKKSKKQFIAFIVQAFVSLLIANIVFIGGLWVAEFFSTLPNWLQTNIAKGLSMYLSSLASFFFNKHFVFKDRLEKGTS
ncbi:GtrA family protein [Aquibacillus koreensis]|uniref:GtrA family protein n=1 Tax=Aquibacillus koreensis TaxID=279446 RepID=A0A9X3WNG3_9BACI|nr:GtrA family protein [Aquibacillus koreensis]MCT2536013.1 GtrA family protein [Aquibacillus koreensis]MDC3420469.1 GtrA family protein [Aquibacillus koreensis]